MTWLVAFEGVLKILTQFVTHLLQFIDTLLRVTAARSHYKSRARLRLASGLVVFWRNDSSYVHLKRGVCSGISTWSREVYWLECHDPKIDLSGVSAKALTAVNAPLTGATLVAGIRRGTVNFLVLNRFSSRFIFPGRRVLARALILWIHTVVLLAIFDGFTVFCLASSLRVIPIKRRVRLVPFWRISFIPHRPKSSGFEQRIRMDHDLGVNRNGKASPNHQTFQSELFQDGSRAGVFPPLVCLVIGPIIIQVTSLCLRSVRVFTGYKSRCFPTFQ